MNPFALSPDAARTGLLLALFLALMMMLALVFVTFRKSAKRIMGAANVCLFLGFFVLLVVLCAKHKDIADVMPLVFPSTIPIGVLWCAVGALFLYTAFGFAAEHRRRSQTIDRNSIKEALDTLPIAVCYFTDKGLVKLCNLQMYRLFYALSQSDLQSLDGLHRALDSCDSHTGIIRLSEEESVFLFPGGTAWYYTEEVLRLSDDRQYTEAIFYDVTALYEKRQEIEAQTKALKELGRSIRALSENVVAATKEEEMLSFKTALHDRMGAGLVAAQQVLLHNRPSAQLDTLIEQWRQSVSLVKQDNDALTDRGELPELIRDANAIGVEIRITGEFPSAVDVFDVFLNAIRECLTNCVRHADGTELYVRIAVDADADTVTIANNGKPPQEEILPRGGLSNLIKRVGYLGGTALIQSFPVFGLTVTIPKKRGLLP